MFLKKSGLMVMPACLFFLLFLNGSSFAASNYYIDTINGSNGNTGTLTTQAWYDFSNLGSLPSGQDIVIHIRGGNYALSAPLQLYGLNCNSLELRGDYSGSVFSTSAMGVTLTGSNMADPVVNIVDNHVTLNHLIILTQSTSASVVKTSSATQGCTLRNCIIQGNEASTVGVNLDQGADHTLENNWIHNAAYGVWFNDSRNTYIKNNTITYNSITGIKILGYAENSHLFNNIISANSNYQIDTQYIQTYYYTGLIFHNAWTGSYNLLSKGSSGAHLALIPGEDIENLLYWYGKTQRDNPKYSFSYNVSLSPTSLTLAANQPGLGGGINAYNTNLAPGDDIFGMSRPQPNTALEPDMGAVEIAENNDAFNRLVIIPNNGIADPEVNIGCAISLFNSQGQKLNSQPLYDVYIGLYHSSYSLLSSHLVTNANISGSVDAVAPGIFRISKSAFGGADPIIQVHRSETANFASYKYLQAMEWSGLTWSLSSNAANLEGGRANTITAAVRWSKYPDPDRGSVSAMTPALASGVHPARIDTEPRDSSSQLIYEIRYSDFEYEPDPVNAILNGGYTYERPGVFPINYSGRYYVYLYSAVAQKIQVTPRIMGVLLNKSVEVEFQPGVWGYIRDANTNLGIKDISVRLSYENKLVAEGQTNSVGGYALLVPNPQSQSYDLEALDFRTQGVYSRVKASVLIPADTALRQDLQMSNNRPPRIQLKTFPNPARRGTRITIPYGLPHNGLLTVELYDLRGKFIKNIIREQSTSGEGQVTWIAANEAGKLLAPGTYMVVIKLDEIRETRKLVIVP
jgi:parallel beta-helix repeat protein